MEILFENASRQKLRFNFKGSLSVEDLWDLPLNDLDAIYKQLNKSLSVSKEESLLETKSADDQKIIDSISIVKHIAYVRLAEANAKVQEKALKDKKEKIRKILESKQDEELSNKSAAELEALLESM